MKDHDTNVLEELYIYKIYNEANPPIPPAQPPAQPKKTMNVKTFGDLVNMIKNIESKQKFNNLKDAVALTAVDQVIGLIPGGSSIKSAYDFFKKVYNTPDTKKTNTFIDKLDVDDEVSKIVDDTVENNFLKFIVKHLQSYDPNTPIPPDWNMTQELIRYLKATYKNRSAVLPQQGSVHQTGKTNQINQTVTANNQPQNQTLTMQSK